MAQHVCSHVFAANHMPMWEFATQVYSKKAMEEQLLQLQDEYEVNVNIALWCCWLEVEGISVSADVLLEVLSIVNPVSDQTVAKLREVRRALYASGSFTKVQAQSIKKQILSAELMVEKILLHRLQDMTSRFLESVSIAETGENLGLCNYLEYLDVPNAIKRAELVLDLCRDVKGVEAD